jgi:hypothetical protein
MDPAAMVTLLSELIASYDALLSAGERGIRAHQEFLEAQRTARTAMFQLRAELLAHHMPPSKES